MVELKELSQKKYYDKKSEMRKVRGNALQK